MKKNLIKSGIYSTAIALLFMASCDSSTDPIVEPEPETPQEETPQEEETRWITLTAALKQTTDGDGNGGTLAYAITHDQAVDPTYELDIFPEGKGLKLESPRTSRVQASADGKYLYDIQYTGTDGGIFQKFRVDGEGTYVKEGNEVNTAIILGTSPRWVKSAEGVGIGVSISTSTAYTGTFPAVTFGSITSTAVVASLDLDNPSILNTASFEVPFTAEQLAAGYSISRIDVPIINQAGDKVYIGANITKIDPTGTPTQNSSTGVVSWPSDANIAGTVTLVLDYPTFRNPKVIWSTQSKYGNNGYRTMIQYIGDDGHVYQATGVNTTGYPHILRIDKNTNDYDNTYLFDLSQALGISGVAGIKAWKYLGDNKGFVLYDIDKTGGYLALIDLNAKTATRISTEYESQLNFDQHQSIAVEGDYVYVPLTPVSLAGNVFVYNWKTGELTKGAKLANGTGHRYIGAY